MKNALHVIKVGEDWTIRYPNGTLSEMSSRYRAAIIGWALSLGHPVWVFDEAGRVEERIEAEKRSRFHFVMFTVVVSFVVMLIVVVWALLMLFRWIQSLM